MSGYNNTTFMILTTYLYMIFVKLSFRTTLLTTKSEFKCDKSILSNSAVKEIRKYYQK